MITICARGVYAVYFGQYQISILKKKTLHQMYVPVSVSYLRTPVSGMIEFGHRAWASYLSILSLLVKPVEYMRCVNKHFTIILRPWQDWPSWCVFEITLPEKIHSENAEGLLEGQVLFKWSEYNIGFETSYHVCKGSLIIPCNILDYAHCQLLRRKNPKLVTWLGFKVRTLHV